MHTRPFVLTIVVLLTAGSGLGGAQGVWEGQNPGETHTISTVQQSACNFTELYDRTIDSVVSVRVETARGTGEGSGFVYDVGESNETNYIVTNQHVVADATDVEVQFNRGEFREAEVVGTAPGRDLAVLRVQRVPNYVDSLSLDEDQAEPGQPVAALGSPLGLQGTITQGVVSGVNRTLPTQRGVSISGAIQTDAPINPGNSGGPLVSCAGQVVGVNTAGIQGGENLGFAIPARLVRETVPELIENADRANRSN